MKPTMRLTPLNWMISTEMKQPANYPQQPDDSTEELPESDDDEPKESHQCHQVTRTGRVPDHHKDFQHHMK